MLDSHECPATECSNSPASQVDTDNHAKVSDTTLQCQVGRVGFIFKRELMPKVKILKEFQMSLKVS